MERDFHKLIDGIRSDDPMTYEDAYHALRPHVSRFAPELLELLPTAPDPHTRGRFIELLGDAADPRAIPALARELEHANQNVRQWAVTALTNIGGAEAEAHVRRYRERHPEEFA